MTSQRQQIRAQIRAEQEKIARGTDWTAKLDRVAWSAAGQRVAGEWSWGGMLSGLATFVVLAVLLVFVLDTNPSGVVFGLTAMVGLVVRGRVLHDRYVKSHGT